MEINHPTTDTREVEPNARYDAIYGTNHSGVDPDSDRMDELREETQTEAAVLRSYEEEMEEFEENVPDEADAPTLSWEDVSVTQEPQLLASICSYFSGVSSGEEVEEIRRKLRTGRVEWYVNALLVAKGILDPDEPGPVEEGES